MNPQPGRYPIITHIGCGDGILQSGLAVALLDKYEEVAFPCYPQYEATFKSIFANYPRISVYTVPRLPFEDWGSPRDPTYEEALVVAGLSGIPQIRLGVYAGRGIDWDFSKSFYQHAQIDYRVRWTHCPIRKAAELVPQDKWRDLPGKKIFLHEDAARGYPIIRLDRWGKNIYSPPRECVNESILRYAEVINTADEVHVFDSAMLHLVDSLDPVGELFLHGYVRWNGRSMHFRFSHRYHWNYIL
jgi:hypothetical protein